MLFEPPAEQAVLQDTPAEHAVLQDTPAEHAVLYDTPAERAVHDATLGGDPGTVYQEAADHPSPAWVLVLMQRQQHGVLPVIGDQAAAVSLVRCTEGGGTSQSRRHWLKL